MKRFFGKTRALVTLTAAALGIAALSGCSDGTPGSRAAADMGSVGLALQLAPGSSLASATYTITGTGGFSRTAGIDVSKSATLSVVVGTIPAGTGYTLTVNATATDGVTSCLGAATFAVIAGATTPVGIHLTCHGPSHSGSISVTGTINVCPNVDGVSASPSEVIVGGSIALAAVASDVDSAPAPLAYQWTASSGTLSSATVAAPTFTCAVPGTATIAVTVSDGDTAAGCTASASVTVTCSIPGAGGPAVPTTVAVFGDVPYGTTPTDSSQLLAFPGFIASVNADPDVSLTMHIGDIHSGKQFCTQAYDQSIFDLWTTFADPLLYTPGDNEWTDCHKAAQGGGTYNPATMMIDYLLDAMGNPVDYAKGDPVANLALVRSIFFPTPGQSLGIAKRAVLSQAQVFDVAHPSDAKFVENVIWEASHVLFVHVNIPGGSNNDTDVWYGAPTATAAQNQEVSERTDADLRWLDLAFAQARADDVYAVVIGAQADMWDPEKGAAHQAGYEPFVQSIAQHTLAFGKPVIMFNGDSHVYQTGNPLSSADPNYAMHPGYDVPNFHRVVVHGSTTPFEWLKLTIAPGLAAPNGPDAFGPFSWTRVILP